MTCAWDFIGFLEGLLASLWSNIGSLKTPQATLMVGAIPLFVLWVTISKNRKISREKNSLEFEVSCQSDGLYYQHNNFVRKLQKRMQIDSKIDDSLRAKVLKDYIDLPKKMNEIKKMNISEQKKSKKINKLESDHNAYQSISLILNHWERCASAIRHNIYDECLIYSSQASGIINLYKSFSPFIDALRERTGNRRYLVNLEWLATKWEVKHTKIGSSNKRSQKTIEIINVARIRIEEHCDIRKCHIKLLKSKFWLWRYKRP